MSISKDKKRGTRSISLKERVRSAVAWLKGQGYALVMGTRKPSERGKKNRNEWARLDRYQ